MATMSRPTAPTVRRCKRIHAVLVAYLVLSGCSSLQRIEVQTDPMGAHVFLQRRGDLEIHGRVAGVTAGAGVESFEEDFVSLGNTPVLYEFERRETEAAVHLPEVGANVTRHFREGTLRIELDGYRTVLQVRRFSGEPIVLFVRLEPDSGEQKPPIAKKRRP